MNSIKPLARCLAVAFGGSLALAALPTFAQQQPAQPAQKQERIEVTGSAIKRIQAEGPAPVEVYSRRDIERTGATTVTELLKNIASIDIDDQGEQNGNSPSGSGTSNVQIRGLSERDVLVLLNGRRIPTNALQDGSGAGAAVDVNNIPISAIERVEILKDGGSAIYGSDAVAGVINFITRKNYNGLEASLGYGVSKRSDGEETPFKIVGGFGDYDKSGFNVLASFDYFKREPVLRKDRDLTKSADFRRFSGGADGRSVFAPQGNFFDPNVGLIGGYAQPCPPENQSNGGALCRYDFNASILDIIVPTERYSALVVGSLKLSENLKAFTEVMYSRAEATYLAHPAPGFFPSPLSPTGLVAGRFLQAGPRTLDRESTLGNLTLGLEGSTSRFDWDVAYTMGNNKVLNQDSNYLDQTKFFDALFSANPNEFIDATSTNNPQANVDRLKLNPTRRGNSEVRSLGGKISGQLMELAGGPFAFAAGVNLGREELTDTPDLETQRGNVFGSIIQSPVDARRKTEAVFVELSIPFLKDLETQIAVRTDRYKDSGAVTSLDPSGNPIVTPFDNSFSSTSPKIAAKYKVASNFLVRASYAESFLAPSLKQQFGSQEQGAESTSNPAICGAFGIAPAACNNFPYLEVSGSNPRLKPEKGQTINVGLVVEPTPNTSVAVDFFRIEKEDQVSQLSAESAAARGDVGRSASGEFLVFVNNLNLAQVRIKGVDLDVRGRFNTPIGTINLRNATTYYDAVDQRVEASDPYAGFAGTWSTPRLRNSISMNWQRGPWEATVVNRYTKSFYDSAVSPVPAATRVVGSYDETDMSVDYRGFAGLKLTGGIKNVFDRMPPFSVVSTTNQFGSQGFPWIYSPRGRFFYVNATYKFF
jgi:iron complex outermembrane receptor protein